MTERCDMYTKICPVFYIFQKLKEWGYNWRKTFECSSEYLIANVTHGRGTCLFKNYGMQMQEKGSQIRMELTMYDLMIQVQNNSFNTPFNFLLKSFNDFYSGIKNSFQMEGMASWNFMLNTAKWSMGTLNLSERSSRCPSSTFMLNFAIREHTIIVNEREYGMHHLLIKRNRNLT